MYHSHHDEMTQIGMGMTGMVVIHRRKPRGPKLDRDFALLLHEWRLDVGTSRPNPNEMKDFNLLTINAKAFRVQSRWWCKQASACASVLATFRRWIITRYTCTAISPDYRDGRGRDS